MRIIKHCLIPRLIPAIVAHRCSFETDETFARRQAWLNERFPPRPFALVMGQDILVSPEMYDYFQKNSILAQPEEHGVINWKCNV